MQVVEHVNRPDKLDDVKTMSLSALDMAWTLVVSLWVWAERLVLICAQLLMLMFIVFCYCTNISVHFV